MKTVGLLQEGHYTRKPLHTLVAGNKAAFHRHNQSSDAKTAATCSNHILIIFGILAIEVDALAGKTRGGLGAVPHVVKVDALDVVQHGIIVLECCGTNLLVGRDRLFVAGFGIAGTGL